MRALSGNNLVVFCYERFCLSTCRSSQELSSDDMELFESITEHLHEIYPKNSLLPKIPHPPKFSKFLKCIKISKNLYAPKITTIFQSSSNPFLSFKLLGTPIYPYKMAIQYCKSHYLDSIGPIVPESFAPKFGLKSSNPRLSASCSLLSSLSKNTEVFKKSICLTYDNMCILRWTRLKTSLGFCIYSLR